MKKFIIFLLLILFSIFTFIFYYKHKYPYNLSNSNIKLIYCLSHSSSGEKIIDVNDSDKDMILSELSKMKSSNINGQVATLGYTFYIELNNEKILTFYENSSETISLQCKEDNFFRNIYAPNTAKFIKKFIQENNLIR